jgi:hypothetical protein
VHVLDCSNKRADFGSVVAPQPHKPPDRGKPSSTLGETLMVRENPPGQDIHVMVIALNDEYQRISRPPPIKFA